jgi:hypothetical protein
MEPIEPPWQAIKEWIAAAPLWPCGQQDSPPDLVWMMHRKNAAKAFLATNPTSTDSIAPGIHPIPKDSTKAKHSRHLKSIWTMIASWFSNTPEDPDRLAEKPLPKEILAKRTGKLRSRQMNVTVKTRNDRCDTAVASRFSSLLNANSALFTSSAPPPVRPPSLSTALTSKANS